MYVDCPNCTVLVIRNNVIAGNMAEDSGGGIFCYQSSPTIQNNIISDNYAGMGGGGLFCRQSSSPAIRNNTVAHNSATDHAGGMFCDNSSPTIVDCIIWGNGDDRDGWLATYGCIEDND